VGAGKVKPLSEKDTSAYFSSRAKPIPPDKLKYYQDNIEAFYEKYLVRSGFNGGILVAKNGQVIFEKYRGYYDLNKKDSLTPHSAFHLASVSKTFTAMAVLRLVMEHRLELSDTVQKFFPDFPYEGVTIKMLLSHRSGLPNYIYFMEKLGWPSNTPCTNQDILDYMIKFKPPVSSRPDTHFQYCNTNFSLLALIIEKVSGMKYEDYLKKEFFLPLGMKDTYVYELKRDSASAMPSFDYRGRREAFTFLDEGVGDKNIYSTPEDLFKWDQALYTNVFFSADLLNQAFTPYSNEKPGIRNYGLGWRMNVYPDGRKIIYHNGWWHGNNTVFIRDIQDELTIIVLGNKFNKNIYQSKKIAEIFEGGRAIEDE
jgi:CubicO group peptidase (beta-lactamase class C family)